MFLEHRKKLFNDPVSKRLKRVCVGISKWYEINFIEIEIDKDHVYYLIQSVSMNSPEQIVQILKIIMKKELFKPDLGRKEMLLGGRF